MSRGYDADELFELADANDSEDVELGSSGDKTGVVLPAQYVPGQLLTPNEAERLGAQLLLTAQLHDAIAASGSGELLGDDPFDAFARAARRMRDASEAFAPPSDDDAGDRGWVAGPELGQLVMLWAAVSRLLDAGDLIESDVAIARDLRRTIECELARRGRPVDPMT